jgi:putative addiction module killer protein
MVYNSFVIQIIQSDDFKTWLKGLRDRIALAQIIARLARASLGNLGDWKALRSGVSEMRVNVGAGYRLYFMRRGNEIIVLLCGGDKRNQAADIERAVKLSKTWKDSEDDKDEE